MIKNENDINHLWCITEEKFSIENNKHFEGLFTQGNGYMHVRGSFEEGINGAPQDEEYMRMPANVTLEEQRHPKSKWGTFVPGIVGEHPLLKEEIINLPWFLEINFHMDGQKLDMESCDIRDYKRWLDLRDGSLHRVFTWYANNRVVLSFEYCRFASMADKHLYFQQVKVKVLEGKGELAFDTGIDGNVRTNGYNHFHSLYTNKIENEYIFMETTTDKGNRVMQLCRVNYARESELQLMQSNNRISYSRLVFVEAGEEIELYKTTVVVTDRDLEVGSLQDRATACVMKAEKDGYRKLYEKHAAAWTEKWYQCDIRIDGDDEAQLAIRMSIYHLLRSCAEEDPRVAICAKGYAGEAYFGRYFWDTEINLLPFYIYTNPKAAKNLIMYRYNTLEGARNNARAYGYNGARYPWESSITGEEQCACWQYADHEIHITADVVYAMCHYALATGDLKYVNDYGMDILVETARYWVERMDWNKKGYCELLGVMGPDEYLPMTRNNAYTNRMVKYSLKMTVEFLEQLKREDLNRYGSTIKRLNLKDEEIEKFSEMESKLILPYDQNTEIVPQSEDFENYADLDFNKTWKDRTRPFGYYVSQEKNYRSKALKQADVLELMMLFPNEFTSNQMIKAYEYYEPITTHDSSLSAAVHGIIAAWTGKLEEAEKFFKKVMEIDMSENKKGAAEGIHIANCGGLWQLVVFGFAGLKSVLWNKEIILKPSLPHHWNSIEFSIVWHGEKYKIQVSKEGHKIIKSVENI